MYVDKNELRGAVTSNLYELINSSVNPTSMNWDVFYSLVNYLTNEIEAAYDAGYGAGHQNGLNKEVERNARIDRGAVMQQYWDDNLGMLKIVASNLLTVVDILNVSVSFNEKIKAIKFLRDVTGCSLKAAKDTIMELAVDLANES